VENAAPSKLQGWKTREWKTWHQVAGVENAGVENAEPSSKGGKCGSGKRGTRWRVENAGVENAAPSSGAYSGFKVRWCEAKESRGQKSPSVIQKQSPGRESGRRAQKAEAQAWFFYQNGSIASHACAGIAISEMSVRLFVCPSVCPSHSDIVSKRTNLASFMVTSLMESAKTIVFANIQFILKFERGHLERGLFMRLGWYELRTGSASNGLACSGFQTELLGSLQSYAYTASSKNVGDSTFWRYKFYGVIQ